MTVKYKPTTKQELKELVQDESINLGDIDTSLITDMEDLFLCENRSDWSGIETWDVSNVTDMSRMFSCSNFKGDISNWKLKQSAEVYGMFSGCCFSDLKLPKELEFMEDFEEDEWILHRFMTRMSQRYGKHLVSKSVFYYF